jgi:hypothetical protein
MLASHAIRDGDIVEAAASLYRFAAFQSLVTMTFLRGERVGSAQRTTSASPFWYQPSTFVPTRILVFTLRFFRVSRTRVSLWLRLKLVFSLSVPEALLRAINGPRGNAPAGRQPYSR